MTATASEIKTAVYRIFKKDEPGTRDRDDRAWHDLGVITCQGRYSARPSAEFLGDKFGEGQYMYFEADKDYATVDFTTVVAETVYREFDNAEKPS